MLLGRTDCVHKIRSQNHNNQYFYVYHGFHQWCCCFSVCVLEINQQTVQITLLLSEDPK